MYRYNIFPRQDEITMKGPKQSAKRDSKIFVPIIKLKSPCNVLPLIFYRVMLKRKILRWPRNVLWKVRLLWDHIRTCVTISSTMTSYHLILQDSRSILLQPLQTKGKLQVNLLYNSTEMVIGLMNGLRSQMEVNLLNNSTIMITFRLLAIVILFSNLLVV